MAENVLYYDGRNRFVGWHLIWLCHGEPSGWLVKKRSSGWGSGECSNVLKKEKYSVFFMKISNSVWKVKREKSPDPAKPKKCSAFVVKSICSEKKTSETRWCGENCRANRNNCLLLHCLGLEKVLVKVWNWFGAELPSKGRGTAEGSLIIPDQQLFARGMASFFNVSALGGNPFSTPVGQRIGKSFASCSRWRAVIMFHGTDKDLWRSAMRQIAVTTGSSPRRSH